MKTNISIELNDNELVELLYFANEKYTKYDGYQRQYQSRVDGGEKNLKLYSRLRYSKSQSQFYKGIVSKLRKSMADPEKRRAS